MPESPLVTVLMTVYNGLPYLREALDSVLGQTFGDFEFLIIDDASTDASVDCIRSYGDPRIRLECNDCNIGQAASLNRGLALARGFYVARIDQDDVSLPDRLEKQVVFLEQRPEVVVVGTWGYEINSRGRRIALWRKRIDGYGEFVGSLLLGRNPLLHPSVMFRRDVVMDVGGYDSSFGPAEDYELWVRLAMRRHTANNIPEFLVLYRVHEGRQSVTRLATQLHSSQRAHDRMVAAFCHPNEAQRVGLLLRIEDDLWTECRSRAQLGAVLCAAEAMLQAMECRLMLSPGEVASLRRTLSRRLGCGVGVGAKTATWPSVLFYPIFFLLSPMMVPRAWRTLLPLALKLRQLIHRVRMLVAGVDR